MTRVFTFGTSGAGVYVGSHTQVLQLGDAPKTGLLEMGSAKGKLKTVKN